MDNLLVKSKESIQHLANSKEAFTILRWYNMKFNSTKCMFVIELGNFLGLWVSKKGVKANPKKIQANLNEVQRRKETLNRFVLKSTNKYLPFFRYCKRTKSGIVTVKRCSSS